MQIDPRTSMYLNIVALILSVFATAAWWADFLSASHAADLTGIMVTTASAINIVLHAYSSSAAGPAAK